MLSIRARAPNSQDIEKLRLLVWHVNFTKHLHVVLSIENIRVLKWAVRASFVTGEDFSAIVALL